MAKEMARVAKEMARGAKEMARGAKGMEGSDGGPWKATGGGPRKSSKTFKNYGKATFLAGASLRKWSGPLRKLPRGLRKWPGAIRKRPGWLRKWKETAGGPRNVKAFGNR